MLGGMTSSYELLFALQTARCKIGRYLLCKFYKIDRDFKCVFFHSLPEVMQPVSAISLLRMILRVPHYVDIVANRFILSLTEIRTLNLHK
jgi:hypothetical protein